MLIVISVTQQLKYLQIGNIPPYINYMYTGRMSRFFATYETETNISAVSVPVSNADFISTLQFTTKTRIHLGIFLIQIYIVMF